MDPLRLLLGSSIAAAGATRVATAAVGCFLARFPEALDPKIVDSVRDVLQNTHVGTVSKRTSFELRFGRDCEAHGVTWSQAGPLWIAFGILLRSH